MLLRGIFVLLLAAASLVAEGRLDANFGIPNDATSRTRPSSSKASTVTVSNVKPRRDNTGAIMDAHDSKMSYFNGKYYWFAASYGDCVEPNGDTGCAGMYVGGCGFQTDHNVTLFTTADFVNWENEGVVFSSALGLPPNSILFAPKTVFNPVTKKWVMWFNYIVGSFENSFYGVATADTPKGPFQLEVQRVNTLQFEDNGDENLFVDEDGSAYLVYTTLSKGHSISIEKLTPDYMATEGAVGSSGLFGDTFVEAPAMFKRGAIYYVAFGSCCCYCESGSAVTVYTSMSPLGPFVKRSSLGDLHSQATDIFAYTDANNETQFMYIGDHWQSSPDRLKSHDFTVWAPLLFSDDGLTVTTKGFQDEFVINVGAGGGDASE